MNKRWGACQRGSGQNKGTAVVSLQPVQMRARKTCLEQDEVFRQHKPNPGIANSKDNGREQKQRREYQG